MNLADRQALAAANRTRHRPQRSNVADLQTEIDRLQSALRDVADAGSLAEAAATAGTALGPQSS